MTAGVYLAGGLVLMTAYQHKLYPDTLSYVSIARKYLAGDLAGALNSYWAPLLSWAITPLLWAGITPLLALKIVALLAGAATLVAADRLFARFAVASPLRKAALSALAPGLLYFALSMPTPDLLLVAALTAYFAVIFRDDYAATRSSGVWCGALGGLAYFAKHYALPFFVAHFVLLNAWHWRRAAPSRRPAVLFNLGAGLIVFAVIVTPWVAAISWKYGDFTIGTSGARTYAYVGPATRGDTLGPHGLVAPPNPTATSAWEDPTVDMLEPWSPFASLANLRHQAGLLIEHTNQASLGLLSFSPLTPLIVIAFGVFGVVRWRLPKSGLLLATAALYLAGYLWVFIEVRYLWPLCVLLMLMTSVLLTHTVTLAGWSDRRRLSVAAIALASFVVVPIIGLARDFGTGREIAEVAEVLKVRHGVGGNIAAHNQYRTPLYLTYYLGGRFYGTSDRTLPEARVEALLLAHGIDYYVVLTGGDDRAVPGFLRKYREIAAGELSGLRVYAIRADISRR